MISSHGIRKFSERYGNPVLETYIPDSYIPPVVFIV